MFYLYYAQMVKVIDGDTIVATIDVGFDLYVKKYIRLAEINAPELNSTDPVEREKAQASKVYLESILPIGSKFIVNSKKLDPYRRPIVEIFLTSNPISINQQMIDGGYAVNYK